MQHLQPNPTLQGGKHRIERVLGQGGFGNTYVGYNTEFEETVAIKECFIKGVTERDETTSAVSVSNADNVAQFEEQREKFKKRPVLFILRTQRYAFPPNSLLKYANRYKNALQKMF